MQTTTQRNALLKLHLAPRFSIHLLKSFISQGIGVTEICSMKRAQLESLKLKAETINAILDPNQEAITEIIKWSKKPGNHLVFYNSQEYPKQLKNIAYPPFLLYVNGNVEILAKPQLAIVGTRLPSYGGIDNTKRFTTALCKTELIITSGLALGVDYISHTTTLKNKGSTIAVLGSGLNNIYPNNHKSLAHEISKNGAVISEYPPHSPAKKYHFPQRNRIISGLSLGTLVTEAGLKSGSLITAHYAAEQGKEVFAIPGNINNPLVAGCHYLIQEGAKLTTTPEDILSDLPLRINAQKTITQQEKTKFQGINTNNNLEQEQQKLLQYIDFDSPNFDQIIIRSGYSHQKASSILCNLILKGYIREEYGRYSITAKLFRQN